jgi:hypothetical protein
VKLAAMVDVTDREMDPLDSEQGQRDKGIEGH